MKTRKLNQLRILYTSAILICLLLLAACGSGSTKTSEVNKPEETDESLESHATETDDNTIQLVINGDDMMKFDKSELRVKAGSKVEIMLNHTGTMAKDLMGHNIVILKQGTDVADFAQRAINAKETEYIPEGDETIAYTSLIGGGESTSVSFDAPEKGTYDFICSFPGHYGMMKGKFIVE